MSTHPNQELIELFYRAFDKRDGEAMTAAYAPDVRFSDPVFPDLRGPQVGAMWRMLTKGADDLQVELLEHEAEATRGTAHWRATYTFTGTGRRVVNDVRATFRFADGLVAEHRDDFSFATWARQALGPVGLVLGWTPFVQSKVRRQAAARLAAFESRR